MNTIQQIEADCKIVCSCECCNEMISTWLVVYTKGICKVFAHLCESCRDMNSREGLEGDEYIKSQ